jgi:hypothetical protein
MVLQTWQESLGHPHKQQDLGWLGTFLERAALEQRERWTAPEAVQGEVWSPEAIEAVHSSSSSSSSSSRSRR